jgi:hypothetical protein
MGVNSDPGVVMPGFEPHAEWFSIIWGDQADDLLAVQIDEKVAGPLLRVPHDGTPPFAPFVDGLREFQLDAVRERLELSLGDHHEYNIGRSDAVTRVVNFHDYCSWMIHPIDEALLRAQAAQQIAFHEEYLECEGALSSYVEPLCELLVPEAEVKFKCTRQGALRVRFRHGHERSWSSCLWWPSSR